MHASTHLENAHFLRELAQSLPQTHPKASTPARVELLQRLADAELEQAGKDDAYMAFLQERAAAGRHEPVRYTHDQVNERMRAQRAGRDG